MEIKLEIHCSWRMYTRQSVKKVRITQYKYLVHGSRDTMTILSASVPCRFQVTSNIPFYLCVLERCCGLHDNHSWRSISSIIFNQPPNFVRQLLPQ